MSTEEEDEYDTYQDNDDIQNLKNRDEDVSLYYYPRKWFYSINPRVLLFLQSLFLAFFIVFFIKKKFDALFIVFIIVLSVLLYIIFSNINGNNIAGSVNSVAYPIPPHLGLDGVNLQNKYPYYHDYL